MKKRGQELFNNIKPKVNYKFIKSCKTKIIDIVIQEKISATRNAWLELLVIADQILRSVMYLQSNPLYNLVEKSYNCSWKFNQVCNLGFYHDSLNDLYKAKAEGKIVITNAKITNSHVKFPWNGYSSYSYSGLEFPELMCRF